MLSKRRFSGANLKTVWARAFVAIALVSTTAIAFLMNGENPKAALVYTQNDGIPDIAFQIASVPLALASFVKYGGGSFALVPSAPSGNAVSPTLVSSAKTVSPTNTKALSGYYSHRGGLF